MAYLSNTATPRYYGEFREKVLRGQIPVCEEISQEMNRVDALIADPRYYYDEDAVEGWVRFCEGELTKTDGSSPVMLDTFKLWGEQIFGWYYFSQKEVPEEDEFGQVRIVTKMVKRRLTVKQYLIVARGAAKSMYAEFIQAYFLIIDTDTTHQITTAPTMRQADEVMAPFRTAITRAQGPLFKFLTEGSIMNTSGSKALRQKLVSTKRGIENTMTESILEVRPMSIDKLQGLRPKLATVDEWLSGDVREDVVGAIEQGASKIDDYLIVAISSEGTVRNGSGDTMKLELKKILKGEYTADHVSIWHYKLDDVKEVAHPELWVKAQPNINITVSYETYQREVERAEQAPASRNDILAKRFGIPMEGFTYFFTYEETKKHRRQHVDGMACSLGADLSQGDDFCAFTFLFPLGDGSFAVKTRSYITKRTHNLLPGAMRLKYDDFINEGTLQIFEGTVLDMEEVYRDLDQFIQDHRYDVRSFGYDPYNSKEFVDLYIQENGSYGVDKVIQGARTESVPLGELKALAGDKLLLFDEVLMSFAMGNAITMEDTNGNRKLMKRRQEAKIDNVAALLDAWVVYKLFKVEFE